MKLMKLEKVRSGQALGRFASQRQLHRANSLQNQKLKTETERLKWDFEKAQTGIQLNRMVLFRVPLHFFVPWGGFYLPGSLFTCVCFSFW